MHPTIASVTPYADAQSAPAPLAAEANVRQANGSRRSRTKLKYHHLGIPTSTPQPGETYLEKFGFYCTDHESNPYGIQWMRFDEDCPLPEIVQSVSHVAFEVDDLNEALLGHEILIEPNRPSPGVRVAFVLVDGAPVELLEYDRR